MRVFKPVHFRVYGDYDTGGNATMCGLIPGRDGKGYIRTVRKTAKGNHYEWKEVASDVPWSRVNVKLNLTTCPVCLVKAIRMMKRQLKARLRATKRPLLTEMRLHRDEHRFGALKKVVGA